jgi:hypothetical protein
MISVALLFLAKELFERSRSTDPSISAEVSLPSTVALICAALAILSIAGFFIYVFVREHHSERRALFGIAITAFLILYAVYLYFNKELPLNSPNKLVDQIAYVFAAIFFLFETRISLGRESLGGYRAFGYCAALLTAYSAIPSLAVFFIKGEIISNSIYETVVTFTLLIFTVSRLLLLRELEADEDCETYKRLAPKAKERDEAVRIADKSFFLEENEKNEDEEENANLEESSAEEAESDGVTEPSITEPTPDGLAEEQTDSANGENKEEKEDI